MSLPLDNTYAGRCTASQHMSNIKCACWWLDSERKLGEPVEGVREEAETI